MRRGTGTTLRRSPLPSPRAVSADPLTRVDLSGDNLTNHVQSLLEVIRDLRICVIRTIAEGDVEAHARVT
jgi:hypothetical protein